MLGELNYSWSMAFDPLGRADLKVSLPAVTQEFIDHLCGSLEMILQQIGRGDGVTFDRGFKNKSVLCPDVSWDVRDRDGEAAIPVGAGVELAAESEQHLRLARSDQCFMERLVTRFPFLVDGGW